MNAQSIVRVPNAPNPLNSELTGSILQSESMRVVLDDVLKTAINEQINLAKPKVADLIRAGL